MCKIATGTLAASIYGNVSPDDNTSLSGNTLQISEHHRHHYEFKYGNVSPDDNTSLSGNTLQISERHRHRYEFNNDYLSEFERAGMIASGKNPAANLVEIIELSTEKHPFFIGVQFHPELRSTVLNPHPLFVKFVAAAIAC
jgi:CTP synthase (UTP-ammonia lyase)